MPYIIKNGKTYTGNLMPITQVQYNALSEAEKNNGIAYFIVDSDAVLDASDVGLGEGNVEDLAGSVAMIETSPATATHAVEDFILWNGQLYEVTASIAVGETLTVGTNISARNVGEELTALNKGLASLDELVSAITFPTTLLNSSDNMNNVDCGTYYQSGSSMPSNAPSGANNAFIIVVRARNIDRIQFWVSVNTKNVQMRSTSDWNESAGTGTNWSAWATL